MIIISKKGLERRYEGETRVILELRGLSTDDKPVSDFKNLYFDNGSVFIEIDTGDVYLYDMDTATWYNVTSEETSTDETSEAGE